MRKQDEENEDAELVNEIEELSTNEPEIQEIEELAKDKFRALRDSLKQCETEKAKNLEELQRVRADFLNSKRRLEEQFDRDKDRIINDVLTDILPLIDSFETAMSDKTSWDSLDETWRHGIEAIHAQLLHFLTQYDLEHIEANGKTFSPHEHEAISNQPQSDKKRVDTVVEVLQKGFKRRGTVIRPAKVVVGGEQ